MCWELCCNYKPILSVRGIKATRATGSTSWTVTKRHMRGKRERKRRGRAVFENRETGRPCFWWFAMARLWFSAPFLSFPSTLHSIVLYLSFLMLLCLLRYLPVCMCIRLHACVCVCASVEAEWHRKGRDRERASVRRMGCSPQRQLIANSGWASVSAAIEYAKEMHLKKPIVVQSRYCDVCHLFLNKNKSRGQTLLQFSVFHSLKDPVGAHISI